MTITAERPTLWSAMPGWGIAADLTPRELLTFAPLVIVAFWIGLYPKPFFQILEQPVNQIVYTVRGRNYPGVQAVNASQRPAGESVRPDAAAQVAVIPARESK